MFTTNILQKLHGVYGFAFQHRSWMSRVNGSVDGTMPGDDWDSRALSSPMTTKTVNIATTSEGPTIFWTLLFTFIIVVVLIVFDVDVVVAVVYNHHNRATIIYMTCCPYLPHNSTTTDQQPTDLFTIYSCREVPPNIIHIVISV